MPGLIRNAWKKIKKKIFGTRKSCVSQLKAENGRPTRNKSIRIQDGTLFTFKLCTLCPYLSPLTA